MQRPKHTRQTRQRKLFSPQHLTWQMLADELHASVIELLAAVLEQALSRNELANSEPTTQPTYFHGDTR